LPDSSYVVSLELTGLVHQVLVPGKYESDGDQGVVHGFFLRLPVDVMGPRWLEHLPDGFPEGFRRHQRGKVRRRAVPHAPGMDISTQHDVGAGGPTEVEPDAGAVLGVWAHPDDEAFLSAGLMARARRSGRRVVVATATRGEHGTNDPRTWPPHVLGPARERELSASLAAVGGAEHHWLGHRDGELARQATDSGAAQVAELIELVRPDTIITFGPDGMTGHPDHRAVSGWVQRAWGLTGRSARLWYATVTPGFHATWGRLNDEIGLWFPGSRPPVTPYADLAARVECKGPLLEAKYSALRAHASQTDPLVELVGEQRFRRWWAEEAFVAAAAPVASRPQTRRRVACHATG
jgi:LmbE family N-acetylglucosaminyl deacetylase